MRLEPVTQGRRARAILTAAGAAGLALTVFAAGSNLVLIGAIRGAINPMTVRYVDRVISDAEQRGAAAVVFTIDTPGGLIEATHQITERMLNARVPVLTYVSPPGAHAASAGTFITLAGHVAAMAPATNVGAAHPVDASGNDIRGDLRLKAENDAAAEIAKIALARGRNEMWAQDAVRKSVSIRDDEAVKDGVVDLVAADINDLLAKADGRTVTTAAGQARLATRGATIETDDPNIVESLLHFVVDPQIAVLLFTIGVYAIVFELASPTLVLPGVVGVIAVVLALFAFGSLDANAAGMALMVFSIVLFIADIKVSSHFLLTAGGLVALVMGATILFPSSRPTFPGFRYSVAPAVIAAVVLMTAAFFLAVTHIAVRLRRLPVATGTHLLLGATGVARSDIAPTGIAYVGGEDWTVLSESAVIPKGAAVRVRRVDGVRLVVEPVNGGSAKGEA